MDDVLDAVLRRTGDLVRRAWIGRKFGAWKSGRVKPPPPLAVGRKTKSQKPSAQAHPGGSPIVWFVRSHKPV
jgi:hypothetical protein